jgi:hypothetical protein
MLLRIIFLIMAFTDGVLLHGMLSRRTVPVSRVSSASTKALAGGIPAIAPLSFGTTRSYTAPDAKLLVAPKAFESSSTWQGKKYWGRKAIPLLGIAAGFYKFGDILVSKDQNPQKLESRKQELLDISDDAAILDPELYEVFLQIKKDYGITEDIDFRIAHPESLPAEACYFPPFNIILLYSEYKDLSKPELINAIAHELEHHRQYYRYPGSFHIDFLDRDKFGRLKNDVDLKAEVGADAAACAYQYCSKCLKSQIYRGHDYRPRNREHGYFTSDQGYFSKSDVRLFAKQAKIDRALCLAHQKFDKAHKMPNIPLKDFLPTIKPSLPTAKFYKVAK